MLKLLDKQTDEVEVVELSWNFNFDCCEIVEKETQKEIEGNTTDYLIR